jgi:DinB family
MSDTGMHESIEIDGRLPSRQSALIEMNVRWLRQALTLIAKLDDDAYSAAPGELIPHRAGAHFRHIVEFYRCFINGLESLQIDYDARQRDRAIEQNRAAAFAAIRKVIRFLETSDSLRKESTIWVRTEDADPRDFDNSFMESSISRELQVLSSHTIHHLAIIAMTLRFHGIEINPEFGMAPSTLRYLATKPTMPAEAA